MLIHYNDADHDENGGDEILRKNLARDALAMDEFREDAAEEKREDKEGNKKAGDLTDGSHHSDDRHDEEAVFVEELSNQECNIVADECRHVTGVIFAGKEGGFESFAPRIAANGTHNYHQRGANLKEEEALAKKRNVGDKIFNEKSVNDVRKNGEKGTSDCETGNRKIWRGAFFFARTAEDDDEDGGHNNGEADALHSRDGFAEDSYAEAERNEWAKLTEDIHVGRVAGLEGFEIVD